MLQIGEDVLPKNPDASIVIRLLNHWASGCLILQAAQCEGAFFLSVSRRAAAIGGGATKATLRYSRVFSGKAGKGVKMQK